MSISPKLRVGIIASSGGSVFIETYKIFQKYLPGAVDFVVVTDRECGIEQFCKTEGLPHIRIPDKDNGSFSEKAREFLVSFGSIDCVLLFYLRLVSQAIYASFPTINFHPSLLPAYPGFNALKHFIKDNGKFLGATAHIVNETIDRGNIVAQTIRPVSAAELQEHTLGKISFLQKTYLALVIMDMLLSGAIGWNGTGVHVHSVEAGHTVYSNPAISNADLVNGFLDLEKRENQKMVQ